MEKRRDELLNELEELHHLRELEVMELFHCIEKTGNQMEDACKFARRLIELGNAAEVLTLKKVVGTQLMNLINNTPKPDVNVALEFNTNFEKFTEVVKVIHYIIFTSDSERVHELIYLKKKIHPTGVDINL